MQNAANEQQSLQLSPQDTANECQQSQTALQSDSLKTQRSGCRMRRKNEAAAPSKKCQKTSHQVDGTSFNTWQSNRDWHPTSKATKDR